MFSDIHLHKWGGNGISFPGKENPAVLAQNADAG